jgi:hypothetical protein
MALDMVKTFESARRVSVPIVLVRSVDQAAAIQALERVTPEHPLLQWDTVRGIIGLNDPGTQAASGARPEDTIAFVDAMIYAQRLPQGSVLFALNAHRQLTSQEPGQTAAAVQAVANLRDQFKTGFRTLVLCAPTGYSVPSELEYDVAVLDHPLPVDTELDDVVKSLYKEAKFDAPKVELLSKTREALSGLSRFSAEQEAAMSLKRSGIDLDLLWERKRIAVEQTRGLKVWRGGESFADLVGLDSIKVHLKRRMASRTPIGCVLFVDEIDKTLANVEHDTTGVRMDQLRTLLSEMEDNEWRGLVAVGVPGGGKSAIAKAFGNEAGVPTVALDMAAMEGSLVGESEQHLRHAMAVVKAIGRGHAYVVATSNAASVMRPELQRRFTDGMWFFDLMSQTERHAAWMHYIKRYALPKQKLSDLPDDDGWTGAEIRNCCRYAWDTGCTLKESAQFIVPMSRQRPEEVERLRSGAHGRFLDATRTGTYRYDARPMERQVRAVRLPEVEEVQ